VAGSYYVYPFEVTVEGTTYALKNIYPQSILSANTTVTAEYDVMTAGSDYDWHQNHLAQLKAANMFAVLWGGGSTTAPVHISSDPIINPFLNAKIANYENSPTARLASAELNDMPAYIAMGTVSEADGQGLATAQLKEQNLDITFHYEGSDGGGDQHCYADVNAQNPNPSNCYSAVKGYTPEITKMVAQASAVTAATGHETVAGEVFYSINMSGGLYNGMIDMGGLIGPNTYDDEALEAHIYNIALEAVLMQQAEAAGHPTIMFLNPDFPAFYQECNAGYCPVQWKAGLSSSTATFMGQPNLKTDFNAAMDRLVVFSRLTTEQAANLKSLFNTAIPDQTSSSYSVPYIVEMYNFIMKELAPSVPFGWGLNLYDNANPMMNEGLLQNVTLNWQYGGAYWLYRVNNVSYLKDNNNLTYTKAEAIQYSADKLSTFLNEVNISGTGPYAPDFIYFDVYERDPIPDYVSCTTLSARVYNGVNLDDYLTYIADTDEQVDNLPVALWQMPGSSLQSTNDPYSGNYAGTVPDWTFGHPSLNNDMSNLSPRLQTIFNGINWNSTDEACYVSPATSLTNYLTLESI
jgi:hypothetical protein